MTIPNESDAKLPYASLLSAIGFAAKKHRDHRRKYSDASPYINHPIAVAEVLARVGGVTDLVVLQAAVLHDTIEDTATTEAELAEYFGVAVAQLVVEVTDDKKLPKADRKRLQVEHAPQLSPGAKLIKLGDKICNVLDVTHAPPDQWSAERRLEYLEWSRRVVAGCRGVNPVLERYFDQVVSEGDTSIRQAL